MPKLLLLSSQGLRDDLNLLHGSRGGAFKLMCLNEDLSTTIPIPRALAKDPDGTLFIGRAASFLSEISALQRELKATQGPFASICASRYTDELHQSLRRQFPYDQLCVTLNPGSDAEALESGLLEEYCQVFGEPPPLNA